MNYMKKFLKPYLKELIIGPAFKLAEAILELMLPIYMARIIDIGVLNEDRTYIMKTGIIMLALAIVGVLCALVCQYTASKVSQGVGTNMRTAMFKHIQTLSSTELDYFGTASLINRVTGDINQVQLGVAMLIRLVIRAPFLCIGGIIMATTLNIQLSVVLMVVLPVFIIVLAFIMLKTVPLYKEVQKKLDSIALVVRENLSGVRVIRAFAKSDYEKARFSQKNQEYVDTAIKVGGISALLNPFTTLVMNLSIVVIIWFGGIRINAGELETGAVIAFINYLIQILAALIVISQLVVLYTKAFASLGRITEVFDTRSSIPISEREESSGDMIEKGDPIIEFKHVSMSYGESKEYTLKDINFTVKKGETIGIIGGTGSGKSTLLNMILRFYDTNSGQVLIKGMNVKDMSKEKLNGLIGMVPQKTTLFTGTIADNIRWGKIDATKEEVMEAASISQSAEFIERLPEKYNTIISQGGVNVSGGQRQRLTIARALVKKPEILMLDDSFNALDYATDRALRTALKETTKDMTCLIVSQRTSTIKEADKIIVLHDGEVAGIGTHSELYKSCSVYREICESQLQTEEVGA